MSAAATDTGAPEAMAPRAVLDACVLFPTVLRELLLAAGAAGLLSPLWSARILEEWRRAALRVDGDARAEAEIAAADARFPDATIPPDDDLQAQLSLPDPDDVHVLASAVAGRAAWLVTLNIRDFPARTLAREDILLRHPDGLFLEFLETHPDRTRALVDGVVAPAAEATGLARRAILKKARLPRLGKQLG